LCCSLVGPYKSVLCSGRGGVQIGPFHRCKSEDFGARQQQNAREFRSYGGTLAVAAEVAGALLQIPHDFVCIEVGKKARPI